MKREGIVYGLPENEYHAPVDELSSTGAKLLNESEAKFKYQVLDKNRAHKAAYDLGSAVHAKVLGVGSQIMEYPKEHLTPKGNISEKAATVEWAEAQHKSGVVLVTPAQKAEFDAMVNAVMSNLEARVLLESVGHSEVSAFATCPHTGVRMRARADRKPSELHTIVDLKTVRGSAHEDEFKRTIFNYGYDLSAGHYVDTWKYATGEDNDFVFIVMEKSPPYLTNVIRITPDWLSMGQAKSLRAREKFAHGMATGEWPGYSGIKTVEAPMMAIYDYQDKYENDEVRI